MGDIFRLRMLRANVCHTSIRRFTSLGKRIVPRIKVLALLYIRVQLASSVLASVGLELKRRAEVEVDLLWKNLL